MLRPDERGVVVGCHSHQVQKKDAAVVSKKEGDGLETRNAENNNVRSSHSLIMADLMEQTGISLELEELPTPTATSAPPSEPGAHAIVSIRMPTTIELDTGGMSSEGRLDGSSSEAQQQSHSDDELNLTVAEPVEHTHELQHAEELAASSDNQGGQSIKTKQLGKTVAFLWMTLIVGLLLLVGILLPLVIITRRDDSESTTTTELATTTTTPATSLEEDLFNVLPLYTQDTILKEPSSPQAQAFQWLLEDPSLALYSSARSIQRYALATMYLALDGPNSWAFQQNWLNYSHHECDWFAQSWFSLDSDLAGPTNKSSPEYPCVEEDDDDGELVYQRLWLWENNLKGTLPLEVSLLQNLTQLRLQVNQIEGTLPSQIGLLSNLEYFALAVNSLEGNIPSEIGLLTKLRFMPWLHNQLTGAIPSEIWQLTTLKMLFLDNNMLSGTIASQIGYLSELKFPYFYGNLLTGELPTEIGLLSNAIHLSLDDNLFQSTIPSQFGQLSSVEHFVIKDNLLTGYLPTQLGLLNATYYIHLGNNQISGDIPTELGQMSSMQNIQLSNNNFAGLLPSQLGWLSALRYLNLASNDIGGFIPSELALLQNLTFLALDSNNMQGSLPVELGLLMNSSLVSLNLSNNPNLSGIVPQDLCDIGLGSSCPMDNKWITACGLSFDCGEISLCGCNCSCSF